MPTVETTDTEGMIPMLTENEILERNFSYHAPKEGQIVRYQVLRDTAKSYAGLINAICPLSRELSLAITKLEEAVMWANSSIARNE